MEGCPLPKPPKRTVETQSLFLAHGELKYVRKSWPDKDYGIKQYFELGATGIDVPFCFYKAKIKQLLHFLGTQTLPKALAHLSDCETRQLEDGIFSQHIIEEKYSWCNGSEFSVRKNHCIKCKVNLVGQVFRGKPRIILRYEVNLKDGKGYRPTHRQIELAICQDEFERMKEFVYEKLTRLPKSRWTVERDIMITNGARFVTEEEERDPDNPDATHPEGGASSCTSPKGGIFEMTLLTDKN
jgi:hypothetical protein